MSDLCCPLLSHTCMQAFTCAHKASQSAFSCTMQFQVKQGKVSNIFSDSELPWSHPDSLVVQLQATHAAVHKEASASTSLSQSTHGLGKTCFVFSASPGLTDVGQPQILLCEFCDASFTTLQGLKGHRDRVHLNKAAHVCSICEKGFMSKEHFEDHMNMHNNIKAHQCPNCSSRFTFKTCLRRHIRLGVCNK